MPTYEYECQKCGVMDIFHSMNEKRNECPNCGGPIKKLFSPGAGIIFKGSGFHQTDYRSESYKSGEKKEKEKTKPKDKKESKSDNKKKKN